MIVKLDPKRVRAIQKKQISELKNMKEMALKMGKTNVVEIIDDTITQAEFAFNAFHQVLTNNPHLLWPFTKVHVTAKGGSR